MNEFAKEKKMGRTMSSWRLIRRKKNIFTAHTFSVVVVSGNYGQKHRNQLLRRRRRRYAKIFADNKSLATNERLTFHCTRKMSPDSISMRVTIVKIRITSASLGCSQICCFSRIFLSLVSFVCVTTIASRLPLTTPFIHLFGDALLTYYTHVARTHELRKSEENLK